MDWQIFHSINDFAGRTAWAHGPARAYARYGIALFAALLLIGLVVARTEGPRAVARCVWAGAAALIALVVNQPIGRAVARARPYATHQNVLVLVSRSGDQSFPSDHAVVVGAVATGLLAVSLRLGLFALLAASLMAFARVYVGAHYPGDVVVGLALGVFVAVVGLPVADRLLTPPADWLLSTRLGRHIAPAHSE